MEQIKAVTARLRRRPLACIAIMLMALAALVLLQQKLNTSAGTAAELPRLETQAESQPDAVLLEPEAQEPEASVAATTPTPEPLVVYMSGAVSSPGVYRLDQGARVYDAVRAAGGPVEEAALTRLNLAARLHDEQHIHVPQVGEALATPPGEQPYDSGAEPASDKVNINSADVAELAALPRIGQSTAQRIVDYRTANGPFQRTEDLMQVKGIGPAIFEAIATLVTVDS